MKTVTALALGVAALALPAPALAVDVLTFEGIANGTPVGNYYAPKYSFSEATLALVDLDDGGSGNFANEPSSNTIMFFLNSNNAVLNALDGFDTGFSFFYTSMVATTITVYSGLDATGDVLATLDLAAQYNLNCTGDPQGSFCNWTSVGVNFAGIARSIDFGGAADMTGFDDITFGSATPGTGAVPEPATWALMILGFGAIGGALRRRNRREALTVRYA